jgi:hypothetical protein
VVGFNANGTNGAVSVTAPLTPLFESNNIGSARGAAGYEEDLAAGSHPYTWSVPSDPRRAVAAAFVVQTVASNTFTSWISDPAFGLGPGDRGFNDDPDGDDLPNGLEAWFGTNPGSFNAGLTNLATDGTTTTFTHPQNPDAPTDVTGNFYDWCSDLETWYSSGDGPSGGPSVTISASTVGATTTVTATASTPLPELYLRVRVRQD